MPAAIERVRLRTRRAGAGGARGDSRRGRRADLLEAAGDAGLDQAVAVNVGAAPTPVEVLEFFHALGIELAELWGMSETCGSGAVNRPGAVKIGTVGPPSPGVEMKLAEDGEVLVPRRVCDDGYRNRPRRPPRRSTPTAGCTPATSATIDADGYLKIVDRKKEMIINAAGKYMSPANIEAAIKTGSPLIGRRAASATCALQHCADRARRRLRAAVGRAERARGQDARGARQRAGGDRGRAGRHRRGQHRTSPGSSRSRSSRSSPATGCPAATS